MSAHSSGLLPPEEFADLHIFVVPLELWLEKYRTAFNNIALESVSAGFVRVLPYVSLYALRDHIEEQLGPEVIPEDYVFLRSVGRCMAVVKENQERLLKAKDFLPPVAYSPEVFVLPGTHDALARPVADAYNMVIATHGATTAGMASTQLFHLPTITPGYPQNPQLNARGLHNGNVFPQEGQIRDAAVRKAVEGNNNPYQLNNKSYELQSEIDAGSNGSESSGDRIQVVNGRRQSEDDGSAGLSENDGVGKSKKTLSEGMHHSSNQESNYEPQVEHSESHKNDDSLKTQKPKLQKRTSSDSSGSNQSGTKTVKFIQPEVYQSLAVPSEGGQLVSPPTPIPSGRVIPSPLPAPQSDLVAGSVERNDGQKRDDQNASGVVPVKDSINDKPKTVKKKKKARPRSPFNDRTQTKDESAYSKAVDANDYKHLAVHSEVAIGGSDSLPSLNEVEERSKFVQFPSPMKEARRPPMSYTHDLQYGDETGQDLSSYQNENSFGNEDNLSNMLQSDSEGEHFAVHKNGVESGNLERSGGHNNVELKDGQEGLSVADDEKTSKADNPKHGKENIAQVPTKGKKTAKKTLKKNPETLDDKFKIPKVPTPPPVKYPQRNNKELEKDTASAKDRKRQEIEDLKAELRRAKNSRVDMEKEREFKVRRAKMLQNQILQQRNHAKNIWKKKFFDEKRKTAPLEEQVNRLRYEVDVQHKALISYLETKEREGNKAQQGPEFKNPSEKTNQRMSLARLQHEVEELKSRIEELKMKLTAEMKKRDAAQKELKQIREELMEKKINLTLTKSQKSLATLTGQENIAV